VCNVDDYEDISRVAAKVHSELCSARRVADYRRLPDEKRDKCINGVHCVRRGDERRGDYAPHATARGNVGVSKLLYSASSATRRYSKYCPSRSRGKALL
jgi:hypothetical protein